MPIKGDTALSSFSGKELAESSAIHGDFNQASINYSGHQNLEVRGAETDEEKCSKCENVFDESEYFPIECVVCKEEVCKECSSYQRDENDEWDWDKPTCFDCLYPDQEAESFGAENAGLKDVWWAYKIDDEDWQDYTRYKRKHKDSGMNEMETFMEWRHDKSWENDEEIRYHLRFFDNPKSAQNFIGRTKVIYDKDGEEDDDEFIRVHGKLDNEGLEDALSFGFPDWESYPLLFRGNVLSDYKQRAAESFGAESFCMTCDTTDPNYDYVKCDCGTVNCDVCRCGSCGGCQQSAHCHYNTECGACGKHYRSEQGAESFGAECNHEDWVIDYGGEDGEGNIQVELDATCSDCDEEGEVIVQFHRSQIDEDNVAFDAESFAVEATEHHEIVLEVESELRGLHKALDIVRRTQREGLHITTAEYEINKEIEFGEGVLAEITEDDFDGGSFGAESFSAESRDELIDTLIEIRQELAKKEGMEDWENESEGPLDSLSSGFIQELIWWVDGDRDTWNTESFEAHGIGSDEKCDYCELPMDYCERLRGVKHSPREGGIGRYKLDCHQCGEMYESCPECDGDICFDCHNDICIFCGCNTLKYAAESFGAEYGKRQRFGNRYVGRDTKGKFISNVSVGRSLKADRRNKSKTPARSGFGHRGDIQKGGATGFTLPSDTKRMIGMGAVLGGILAYWQSKA